METVEEPRSCARDRRAQPPGTLVVVDCLTLWLTAR
jgi:adenosyl cobinamide kinase/adenosyl cobinamide phosphate guanylyltransferase